jgi:hypothetical protein
MTRWFYDHTPACGNWNPHSMARLSWYTAYAPRTFLSTSRNKRLDDVQTRSFEDGMAFGTFPVAHEKGRCSDGDCTMSGPAATRPRSAAGSLRPNPGPREFPQINVCAPKRILRIGQQRVAATRPDRSGKDRLTVLENGGDNESWI